LSISKYYSKRDLWLLFSAVAFPIHIWAFILFFRDLSWVANRTNMWDAIGVGAYGSLVALTESIFIFLITVFLSFSVSTKWDQPQRISLIGTVVLMVSLWAILLVGGFYAVARSQSSGEPRYEPTSTMISIAALPSLSSPTESPRTYPSETPSPCNRRS